MSAASCWIGFAPTASVARREALRHRYQHYRNGKKYGFASLAFGEVYQLAISLFNNAADIDRMLDVAGTLRCARRNGVFASLIP